MDLSKKPASGTLGCELSSSKEKQSTQQETTTTQQNNIELLTSIKKDDVGRKRKRSRSLDDNDREVIILEEADYDDDVQIISPPPTGDRTTTTTTTITAATGSAITNSIHPEKRSRRAVVNRDTTTSTVSADQQLEIYKMIQTQRRQEETLSLTKAIELQQQEDLAWELQKKGGRQEQEEKSLLKIQEIQRQESERSSWPYFPNTTHQTFESACNKIYKTSSSPSQNKIPSIAPQNNATTMGNNPFMEQNRLGIMSQIYREDGDQAIQTSGILHSLQDLHQLRTINANVPLASMTGYSLCIPVLHIKQVDNWSCGYRNLQMLLAFVLPLLPTHHPYIQEILQQHVTSPIPPLPSVQQIQSYMGQSWNEGYDTKGSDYFRKNNKTLFVGSKSKIGAVDVCSLLRFYWNIDSIIVQFLGNLKSRSMIGPFVWSYFHQRDSGCCNHMESGLFAKTLLKNTVVLVQQDASDEIAIRGDHGHDRDQCNGKASRGNEVSNSMGMNGLTKSQHCLTPLYLQWEGHSVTIVGVERSENHNRRKYNFLVMDPQKDGAKAKQTMDKCIKSRTIGSIDRKCLNRMVLPADKLMKKDSQLILCSLVPLSAKAKETYKASPNGITAVFESA